MTTTFPPTPPGPPTPPTPGDARSAPDPSVLGPKPTTPRRRVSPLVWVGGAIVSFIVLCALVSFFWTPWDPLYTDVLNRHAPPGTAGHLLGTDMRGRDIASLLMQGARTTLYVGIVAVGIAAVIGTPVGIIAGMASSRTSEFIMRATDIMLAFPALLMALLFATKWGGSVTTAMIAIGLATVPAFIRVIRSGTMQVMSLDYVLAARVAGRRNAAIAWYHVLPNVMGLVIVQASVGYAIAILAEAALSYLGLGAGPTTPSWGRMLYEAQSGWPTYPLVSLWPALAIILAVLGFNLLGDGLRDRFDPRLAGRS